MDVEQKVRLILDGAAEVITPGDLRKLFTEKEEPLVYWGFECSGYIHLGIGLVTSRKMRHFIDTGMHLIILLADWHSWINNKFGGDMDKIRLAGEYFKHAFTALGVKGSKVEFMWADDLVRKEGYWETLIKVAKKVSLNRVIRSLPIMGRKDTSEINEFAWLIYPLMQATDIFMLGVDVAGAGIDQRKAHMLARDVAPSLNMKKAVFVHTPLLPSLDSQVPISKEEIIYSKMSKSRPKSAIFIHDSEDEVKNKIMKGFCPPKEVERNPFMYLYRIILFPYIRDMGKEIIVNTRKGELIYTEYEDFENDYRNGMMHPLDIKEAAIHYLNMILDPVRKYFDSHSDILDSMNRIMGL